MKGTQGNGTRAMYFCVAFKNKGAGMQHLNGFGF